MVKYSFAPIVNKNSKIIILGTMPSEQSLKTQQYYGNKINHFWKIIFSILKKDYIDDYQQKVNILLENNIALWDVLDSCECIGSLDSNIKQEQINDFDSFFKLYPNINMIFFASTNAFKFFKKHQSITKPYFILPSPSTANARYTLAQKIEKWKSILQYI